MPINLREKLRLYIILPENGDLPTMAEAMLQGGATALQLRMKNVTDREYLKMAIKIRKITEQYDALFIVNDRADIAMASGADGVHLGSDDIPPRYVRKLDRELIIGVTVRDEKRAIEAQKAGASYLGAGSVFRSPSKKAPVIGLEHLKRIVISVNIPVVAIGGINAKNAEDVIQTGVAGIAVMSAVFSYKNIKKAVKELARNVLQPPARQDI